MNRFLYSMRLLSLKHGSEEEYDMFEDFAICRAKNGRMNGARESRLQLEPTTASTVAKTTPGGEGGDDHVGDHTTADTTQHTIRIMRDRTVQSEDQYSGNTIKSSGQADDEKDIPSMTTPPHSTVDAHETCTAPVPDRDRRHFNDLVCTETAKPIHPDPETLPQITMIQVNCVQTNMSKCGDSHP